jgi:hypothetical protein
VARPQDGRARLRAPRPPQRSHRVACGRSDDSRDAVGLAEVRSQACDRAWWPPADPWRPVALRSREGASRGRSPRSVAAASPRVKVGAPPPSAIASGYGFAAPCSWSSVTAVLRSGLQRRTLPTLKPSWARAVGAAGPVAPTG